MGTAGWCGLFSGDPGMKFYLIEDYNGSPIECTVSLKEAKKMVAGTSDSIVRLEIPVNAESVRLLLAGQGGYAEEIIRL